MLKLKEGTQLDQPAVIGLNYAVDNLAELLENPSIKANQTLYQSLLKIDESLKESLSGVLVRPGHAPALLAEDNPLNTAYSQPAYHSINRIRDTSFDDEKGDRIEVLTGRGRNGSGQMNWADDNRLDDIQKAAEEK